MDIHLNLSSIIMVLLLLTPLYNDVLTAMKQTKICKMMLCPDLIFLIYSVYYFSLRLPIHFQLSFLSFLSFSLLETSQAENIKTILYEDNLRTCFHYSVFLFLPILFRPTVPFYIFVKAWPDIQKQDRDCLSSDEWLCKSFWNNMNSMVKKGDRRIDWDENFSFVFIARHLWSIFHSINGFLLNYNHCFRIMPRFSKHLNVTKELQANALSSSNIFILVYRTKIFGSASSIVFDIWLIIAFRYETDKHISISLSSVLILIMST